MAQQRHDEAAGRPAAPLSSGLRGRLSRHLADACLLLALLLVLALSLTGPPDERRSLHDAARDAVARQLGVPSRSDAAGDDVAVDGRVPRPADGVRSAAPARPGPG